MDIVVVAYDGVELADIACVTTAFNQASRCGAADPYRVLLVSPEGDDIECDSGLTLRAHAAISDVAGCDTVVVSGVGPPAAAENARLVGHVWRLARSARRTVSVCTGATVLAEAGLLDGRRATTHWAYADDLARRYPRVTVDPRPVFVRDGTTATSGGVTASLDLTLALIEEDHGAELARKVSMSMVTYLQRPGDQDQLSMFTTAARPDDATLRRVVDYALHRPDDDLSTLALAERVNISPRQLSRLFRRLGRIPRRGGTTDPARAGSQAAHLHGSPRQRRRAPLRLFERRDASAGVRHEVRRQPPRVPDHWGRTRLIIRTRTNIPSHSEARSSRTTTDWPRMHWKTVARASAAHRRPAAVAASALVGGLTVTVIGLGTHALCELSCSQP